MSEFACRKHGYHDETKTHSCPDCYADWLAAKPKAPPHGGDIGIFGMPDADGWYEWKGDDMIRPAGFVKIVWRNGMKAMLSAEELEWKHMGAGGDIVKWRPAQ